LTFPAPTPPLFPYTTLFRSFDDSTLLGQCLAYLYTGFFARHAIKLGAGISNMTRGVHDRGHIQIMTVAHGVVIRIMRRGNFHRRSEEHTSELQSRFDLVCRL